MRTIRYHSLSLPPLLVRPARRARIETRKIDTPRGLRSLRHVYQRAPTYVSDVRNRRDVIYDEYNIIVIIIIIKRIRRATDLFVGRIRRDFLIRRTVTEPN